VDKAEICILEKNSAVFNMNFYWLGLLQQSAVAGVTVHNITMFASDFFTWKCWETCKWPI